MFRKCIVYSVYSGKTDRTALSLSFTKQQQRLKQRKREEGQRCARPPIITVIQKGVKKETAIRSKESHFCCSRAALNFDTLLGGSRGTSEPTSSCFLSRIVGSAGGVIVRWGIIEGSGSFSITVPEKAWKKVSTFMSQDTRQTKRYLGCCLTASLFKRYTGLQYLKASIRVKTYSSWTVLLSNTIAGVTVGGFIVTVRAVNKRTALLKIRRAALTGVTAHAVFTTARLQDGFPWDRLTIHYIHKYPAETHSNNCNVRLLR